MKIITWTYSGSYQCGIDLHAANLKWAFDDAEVHVLTTKEGLAESRSGVARAATVQEPTKFNNRGRFLDYWAKFTDDLATVEYTDEDFFLFSELDIFFTQKPDLSVLKADTILSFLPLAWHYFCVLEGEKKVYPRVWEGAMLIPARIVRQAVEAGVSFSQSGFAYWTPDRPSYDKYRLMTYMDKTCDTMADLTMYCFDHGVAVEEQVRAIHVRGPERLHGDLPQFYRDAKNEDIKKHQGYVNIEVFNALCLYYLSGNPQPVESWDWKLQNQPVLPWLLSLKEKGGEWMSSDTLARLDQLVKLAESAN